MVRDKIDVLFFGLTLDGSIPKQTKEFGKEFNCQKVAPTLDFFVGSYIASLLNSYEALESVVFARQSPDGLRQTLTARKRLRDIKVTIETPVIYA